MTHKTICAVALMITTALPAFSAQVFRAENRVDVTPLAGGSFEVEPDIRYGVPGQWCAASDYARRVLNVPWTSRIYVQGPGSARRSIVFGLDPAGAEPSRITIVSRSAKTPGANFSVQRAFDFCINQRQPFHQFP
jgi:hypothetical protein